MGLEVQIFLGVFFLHREFTTENLLSPLKADCSHVVGIDEGLADFEKGFQEQLGKLGTGLDNAEKVGRDPNGSFDPFDF